MLDEKFQDLLKQISRYPKKRLDVFNNIKSTQQRNVILNLSKYVQYDIVSKLSDQGIVDLLQNLDMDEAGDILRLLPRKGQKEIIKTLNDNLKAEVSLLLSFDPETALDLINVKLHSSRTR
jgi:Mg/Co/Ni transporter MgtE